MSADELNFKLSADAADAVAEMNRAAEAVNRTAEAMRGMSGSTEKSGSVWQSMAEAARRAMQSLLGAAGAMGQTDTAAQQAGRTMSEAARESDKLGESMRRLQDTRPLDVARSLLDVRSIQSIQREIDKITAAYGLLERSGKLTAQELAAAHQSMTEKTKILRGEIEGMGKAGAISSAQHAAAMRAVPAQMSDIIVGLSTGQSPFMVMMQQGGQLKDMFGGIVPAAKAIGGAFLGLIGPATGVAAVVGGMAYALSAGHAESVAFAKALQQTGGASGMTVDGLMSIAASIDTVVGTQGQAAEVLAMLVSTGRVGADGIEQFATATIMAERNLGIEAEQTVAKFAELGKSPVDGIKKLNDGMNFLTAATYDEIKSLNEQGRAAEAAALAQRTYAEALESRAKQAEGSIGALERAWRGIKDAAKEAWDSMLSIGRADTLDQQLSKAQATLASAKAGKGGLFGMFKADAADVADAQKAVDALTAKQKAAADAAKASADKVAREQKGVAAVDYLGKLQGQSDKGAGLRDAMAEYRRNVEAAAAAGKAVSAADQARDEKFIREKFAPKGGGGGANTAQAEADARRKLAEALDKSASDARLRLLDTEQQQLDAKRALGLVSLDAFERSKADIQKRRLDEQEALLSKKIAIESGRRVKDKADSINRDATVADLTSQRDKVRDQRGQLEQSTLAASEARALAEAKKLSQEWATSIQGAAEKVKGLEGEAASAAAGLITDPMKRARAEAEATAQATERAAAESLVSLRAQIDVLRGSGMAAEADMLAQQADRIAALNQDKANRQRGAPDLKAAQDYIGGEFKLDIGDGFGAASQSMNAFVKSFQALNEEQAKYTAARNAQGLTAEQIGQIEQRHLMSQVAGYASLAGAAKGLLKEKTAGYKILDGMEKAARAYEIGMAVKTAAEKMGLISMVTGAKVAGDAAAAASAQSSIATEVGASMAKGQAAAVAGVANQAGGDPYTAFFRMAAMAAAMAALGFAVSGGGGGGGGVAPKNTGTGTVLGDKDAKSESLAKAVEELTSVDRLTMEHSANMLMSLRNIDAGINGLGKLMVGGKGLSGIVSGVQEGTSGGVLGFFGTKTTINSQGIQAGPQNLGAVLDSGSMDAQFFSEVTTKKSLRKAKTSTRVSDADAETESQLGGIFRNVASSLSSAAGALGTPLDDVEQRIRGFTVNLGKIDLKGLSGEEIGERLSAVIGAESDRIAQAALPGLEAWQKVGEGYYQTAIRVSAGVEEAGSRLRLLGIAAVSLSEVGNTQGDAAAEIVRTSILRAEDGLRSGVGNIVETLDGDAEKIIDTYKTLRDSRRSLELFGLGASDLTRTMVEAAGGLDGLKSGLADYESNILSADEQRAVKTGRLADEFKRLGVAMPASKDEFRGLVESASKDTSEAGQRLLGGLLPLSSAFAEVAESATAATSALEDEIKRIRGLISDETATTASLQAQFALKTAQARAGDADALAALPALSKSLLDKAAEGAASREELVREQASVAASLETTMALSKTKTTAATSVTATDAATTATTETAAAVAAQTATTEAAAVQQATTQPATLQPADVEALRFELAEIGRKIATLTEQQQSIGQSVADSTSRTARVLERVTPDGDALSTRTAK